MGMYFDGNNSGIRYGDGSRLIFADIPAISISFWIDNLVLSDNPGFFEITTAGGSARIEALWRSGDALIRAGGRALDSDSFKTIDSSASVLDTNLHHVVIVFDYQNDSAYIYIDGVLDVSDTNMGWTAGNCSNTAPAEADVGGANSLGNAADANFHDFRGYKRALTAKEVMTIYASEGKDGIIDGLELWLKAIEASSGTAITTSLIKDYSPNKWSAFSVAGTTADYAEDPISVI